MKHRYTLGVISLMSMVLLAVMPGFSKESTATSRQIVLGPQATAMEQLAARELQRYLWQVTGTFLEITAGGEVAPGSFLLGQRQTHPLIGKLAAEGRLTLSAQDPGAQGYVLKQALLDDKPVLVIGGSDAVGCLYGVYGLLEKHFGLCFGFAGDVLPDEQKSLDLPPLDERHVPSVAIRGFVPSFLYLQSTAVYSWEDWKSVIDQMAKMRMNLLMVHNYNGDGNGFNEIYHNFPVDGKLPRPGMTRAKTGHIIGLPGWLPRDYRFGGRDLMDDCDFGTEAILHGESLGNEELFARGVTMFQRVIAYAHTRGVKMALGGDVNLCQRGFDTNPGAIVRGQMAADPVVVKARIGQVIRDYPDLDYYVAFCWEGMPKTKETLPIWEGIVKLIHAELKGQMSRIGLAVSSWGLPPDWVSGLPADVVCAPIAGYSARPQDGKIFGTREFWACPWMETDNDDSMFYFPYRILLSDTIDAWQKRSSNTKGLYALNWRNTDAIDAKLWYIAHAPWDARNELKTSRDAYHAYAVANYGAAAAEAVTPIINQNEAFACNMCEMGGARPFREFAAIMWSRDLLNFKGLTIPQKIQIPAASYSAHSGGKLINAGTSDAYVRNVHSGDWFSFKQVDFGQGADVVEIHAACDRNTRVELRLLGADGPVLGQGLIPKGKGGENFQTIKLPIKRTSGLQSLCVAFSEEVYPREELAKAERQLAVVEACMAKASPTQRQRLALLHTRLAAVRDHIRLNLEFPDYSLSDLPGAMASWVMNYIRRVDDISSLGALVSIENRYVQHTYLREKVMSSYKGAAVRPPLDVEARGTPQGAQVNWRDTDAPEKIRGYRVYRDGHLLTSRELPATQRQFLDTGAGEFNYTVTAVGTDGQESLPSVKSRCLAGAADQEAPLIVMVSPPLSALQGQPVHVKARVVDGRAYECIQAKLCYRRLGMSGWQVMPMTRRVRAVFTATLTPELLGASGAEYYVEADDGANVGRFPLAAPNRNLSVMVEAGARAVKLDSPEVRADKGALVWREVPGAHWYRLYRGRTPDFVAGPDSYLTYAAKGTTQFSDMEEDFDGSEREGVYYYRLTAMEVHGFESRPSPAVRVMTATVLKPKQAVLSGPYVTLVGSSQASGGVVAGHFAMSGAQVLFRGVPAGSALRIRYSNGNVVPTRCGLYVQGKRVATIEFPVTFGQAGGTYVDGKRVDDAGAGATDGDWTAFSVLSVEQPVVGEVALRIDKDDAAANGQLNCCNLDRIEIQP